MRRAYGWTSQPWRKVQSGYHRPDSAGPLYPFSSTLLPYYRGSFRCRCSIIENSEQIDRSYQHID